MSTPPAGWHPDPEGNKLLRFWDGQQWTSATRPVPTPQPTELPPETPEAAKKRKQQLIGVIAVIAVIAGLAIIQKIDFSKDDTETAAPETTTSEAPTTTTTIRPPSTTRSYTVPPAARTTESSSISDEEMAFRAGMIRIDFPYRSDIYQLIRKGRAACAEFDAGGSIASVGFGILGENPSWSEEEVGQLIGISIGAYCPEHKSLLPR